MPSQGLRLLSETGISAIIPTNNSWDPDEIRLDLRRPHFKFQIGLHRSVLPFSIGFTCRNGGKKILLFNKQWFSLPSGRCVILPGLHHFRAADLRHEIERHLPENLVLLVVAENTETTAPRPAPSAVFQSKRDGKNSWYLIENDAQEVRSTRKTLPRAQRVEPSRETRWFGRMACPSGSLFIKQTLRDCFANAAHHRRRTWV